MKILLFGGSGRLGTELQKYIKCDAPTHEELDITQMTSYSGKYNIIINSAAYTDVVKAEKEKKECFKVNVKGTFDSLFLEALPRNKYIYISSEYAHNPQNFYSWTKKWAEDIVKTYPNHLIIRTNFVPRPFPHKEAFIDGWTQGDYVDIIAPMIAAEILKDTKGLIYVGTGRKTIFELARQTVPNIKGISVDDIKEVKLPRDYE